MTHMPLIPLTHLAHICTVTFGIFVPASETLEDSGFCW